MCGFLPPPISFSHVQHKRTEAITLKILIVKTLKILKQYFTLPVTEAVAEEKKFVGSEMTCRGPETTCRGPKTTTIQTQSLKRRARKVWAWMTYTPCNYTVVKRLNTSWCFSLRYVLNWATLEQKFINLIWRNLILGRYEFISMFFFCGQRYSILRYEIINPSINPPWISLVKLNSQYVCPSCWKVDRKRNVLQVNKLPFESRNKSCVWSRHVELI